MKKVFVALTLCLFIGTIATSVYAVNNTQTTVVKKDHDGKKKKCDKKSCCQADGKTCSGDQAKTCDKSKTCTGDKKTCTKSTAPAETK